MCTTTLEISNMLCAGFIRNLDDVILEQKLFQNASSKLAFEASILGTTSAPRITHLNSLETETQHVIDFGKSPLKSRIGVGHL